MSAGAGAGIRGAGIREFGKKKNMGIRVRGDTAKKILKKIYIIYIVNQQNKEGAFKSNQIVK